MQVLDITVINNVIISTTTTNIIIILLILTTDAVTQVASEIDGEQRKELEHMILELEAENANLKVIVCSPTRLRRTFCRRSTTT